MIYDHLFSVEKRSSKFFNVMDRKYTFSNFMHAEHRLTKAASFTELSNSRKVILEQTFESSSGGNLIRQYSLEQVFDCTKTRIHEQFNYQPREKTDTSNSSGCGTSVFTPQKELTNTHFQENSVKFTIPNPRKDQMDVNKFKKSILAPPTFIYNQNTILAGIGGKEETPQNCISLESVNNKDNIYQDSFFKSTVETLEKSNPSLGNSDVNINIKEDIQLRKSEAVPDLKELKSKLRNLIGESKEIKKKKMRIFPLIFIILVITTFTKAYFSLPAGIVNYLKKNQYCHTSFNSRNIPIKLKHKIYGQTDALDKLSNIFLSKQSSDGIQVFVFIGRTGVGKSYASEIIKNELQAQRYNILDYHSFSHKNLRDMYNALSRCYCNFLRIDNLKNNDMDEVVLLTSNLIELVKRDNYRPCLIILEVFNTEDVDNNLIRSLDLEKSMEIIGNSLKKKSIDAVLVPFKALSDEAVTKCIREAALFVNVELSGDDVDSIREDLKLANSGCKGAYAKVQVIGKPRQKSKRSNSEL